MQLCAPVIVLKILSLFLYCVVPCFGLMVMKLTDQFLWAQLIQSILDSERVSPSLLFILALLIAFDTPRRVYALQKQQCTIYMRQWWPLLNLFVIFRYCMLFVQYLVLITLYALCIINDQKAGMWWNLTFSGFCYFLLMTRWKGSIVSAGELVERTQRQTHERLNWVKQKASPRGHRLLNSSTWDRYCPWPVVGPPSFSDWVSWPQT